MQAGELSNSRSALPSFTMTSTGPVAGFSFCTMNFFRLVFTGLSNKIYFSPNPRVSFALWKTDNAHSCLLSTKLLTLIYNTHFMGGALIMSFASNYTDSC